MPKKASRDYIQMEDRYGAHNYAPLPVVLVRGRGARVRDIRGRSYFDCLSSYSALNQGHCHPKIASAVRAQMGRLTLTSRAFYNDQLGPLLRRLCRLTRLDMALMMNSGAEAVETAIKSMRLWGYKVKKIPEGQAVILAASNNFHGRTTTIVGFSTDPKSYSYFGPATPGFKIIPYGDSRALEKAITGNTCGFLVEPIQGEAGVRIPPPGYLRRVREICARKRVLLALDEIQTGLGRTGRMLCADYENVRPDLFILGKALSGGYYPISAVASKREVLGLFAPGTHGSTFGGNPLACAISMAALDVIEQEKLPERAEKLGAYFYVRLRELTHPLIREVRGRGLLLAIEFTRPIARKFCEILMRHGVLAKDTHDFTVRLAPPLVITRAQIDAVCAALAAALDELEQKTSRQL